MAGRKTTPRETLMETRQKYLESEGIVELDTYSPYYNNECLVSAIPPLAQQLLGADDDCTVKEFLDIENKILITTVIDDD